MNHCRFGRNACKCAAQPRKRGTKHKVVDECMRGIYREFESLAPNTDVKLRDDGLEPTDFIDVSPVAKLAQLQRERAQQLSLIARLKPFVNEATRQGLPWAYKFNFVPP